MNDPGGGSASGLESAQIPVGGGFWRSLGQNGALIVGYALASLHVVVVAVVALVLGGDSQPSRAAARPLVMLALGSTVLLPLLAMCFLGIGELVRRGRWGGPSGHKPDALLPQGTNTVSLRLLPVRWNAVWVVVTAPLAGAVLWLNVKDTAEYFFGGHLETVLTVNGVLLAAAFGTAVGALVKKLWWLRRPQRGDDVPVHPALARRKDASLGTRFWRSFSFRWRLDIWLCALGAVGLWLAAYAFATREHVPGSDTAAVVLGSIGVVLLLTGLWATTQFWRSGEDLASGESLS